MPNGEERTVTFSVCVIAAGAQSGNIARLAKIGNGAGILSCPLPVEPRYSNQHLFFLPKIY